MSKLGFGAYRVTNESEEHETALQRAIDLDIQFIDTSANYTDGHSELLVGEVLKKSKKQPFIFSKVGYLQGENLKLVDNFKDDLVVLDENLSHSIHPSFIEDQLDRSLNRLQLSCIDCYLLHNPEYYLELQTSDKQEYYLRIKKAFEVLEKLVSLGKIKSYGISSNVFVEPKDNHKSTDIDKVYSIAKEVAGDEHHFKYIQFPLNLIEMGALERQFEEGMNLIERAKYYGIKTVINRPLNAFSSQGFVRLVEFADKDGIDSSDNFFLSKTQSLKGEFDKQKEDEQDNVYEIPMMKQISQLWKEQFSTDAVEQIFWAHFFPFVAQVFGRNLSARESQPFYELYEMSIKIARNNMSQRASDFKKVAIDKGLLELENDKPLQLQAIEKYQSLGVDIILVGMKKTSYVEELSHYF